MALTIADNGHIYSVEEKTTSKGKPYLIVHIIFYSKSISRKEEIIYDDPFSLRFLAFGNNAEILKECSKGDVVFIYGKMANDTYENEHGEKMYYNKFNLIKAAIISKKAITKQEDNRKTEKIIHNKPKKAEINETIMDDELAYDDIIENEYA